MFKTVFRNIENFSWYIRCNYNYWLHGPYGLTKVIEKMPMRTNHKYLIKFGATIGNNCRIERGINLHRPIEKPPFKNLKIGNNTYIGHKVIIDLTCKVTMEDDVAIGANSQIWTHVGYYENFDLNNLRYNEYRDAVLIKKGSRIRSGVIIKHGIKIGERAEVGGGSMVVKNVEPYTFNAGSPAKMIKKFQVNDLK